ncbi:hypothetical protein DKX38_011693 [Salix brachista]|uniref:Uncharacterized protein n=1 Tax=Salix brachista TaxID=2182728 RepID=A0A5N5LZQ0_9ROSI|nr:hypothetical protein DKX38_011693 [Salix brachista]
MMGGDTAMAARIDRKPSIEFEPRTLTMDQIQFAREAALYVMNTRSMEAALSVFTENSYLVTVGFGAGGGCGKTKWKRTVQDNLQVAVLKVASSDISSKIDVLGSPILLFEYELCFYCPDPVSLCFLVIGSSSSFSNQLLDCSVVTCSV